VGALLSVRRGTGSLKNRITEGEFVTTSLDAVDDKARQIYITAAGREKGRIPTTRTCTAWASTATA
jgi:hypothetical protein